MATYRYINEADLLYEDVNDEYDMQLVMGDQFDMYRHGQFYVVHHEDDPNIAFKLTLKQGKALEGMSEELLTVRPDVNNPPYLLFEPKFENVKPMYDYYNKLYFNGACPVVKFKKSANSKIWGMAQLEWLNNKPVYTFHINESTMIDRVLFTNTILHEMIHLFQYAKGNKLRGLDPEAAMAAMHDNHGPQFQAEMHRINSFGFGIIMAGTHEEIARESTEDFYAIVAIGLHQNKYNGWLSWYTHKVLDQSDLENVAAQLRESTPHLEYQVKLYKTKNRIVTYGTNMKSTKTVTPGSLKKLNQGTPDMKDSTELGVLYLKPVIAVELPDYKEAPEKYSQPLDRFYKTMKSYTDDHITLKAKWVKFPLRAHNSQTEKKISVLVGRMKRDSINDADIVDIVTDIRMSYADRFKFEQYEDAMRTFLNLYDKSGVTVPYYKIMKLD
jgi:hypothetical protein